MKREVSMAKPNGKLASAMDKIWAKEAGKRLASLKSGRSRAVSYKDALAKYRSRSFSPSVLKSETAT